ncbi:MAG: DegV family protein [Anaerolineae bacterium]
MREEVAMAGIAIVTDRGCDLSPELQRRYDITMVPLIVRFGGEVILDDGSLTGDEFWDRVSSSSSFPETSQPSAGMFEKAIGPLVEAGFHVLCPLITGRLSGTCNAAHAAAQSFPSKVTVFDTQSLSLGQGMQVLAAAKAAKQGLSLEAIFNLLDSMRARSHLFIALDTVEYLRRGGRAGKVMPILDRVVRALNVKPLLRVAGGELQVMGAARSAAKAISRIVREMTALAPIEAFAVTHARRPDDAARLASTLAHELGLPEDAPLIAEAGPTLSAHAGPGVIAAAAVQAVN